MPAVTTRLEITKQDMRKGRKTGSPVSGGLSATSMPLQTVARHIIKMDLTWM